MNVASRFGICLPSEMMALDAPLFVGLECEVESVRSRAEGKHIFNVTNDGSLRNHGYEFVSPPTRVTEIVSSFKDLHSKITFLDSAVAFSSRTSIHVHVNCANLEEETVRNVILMYALFEEVFFLMVEPSRRHNIHCVPLTETYLSQHYSKDLCWLTSHWHKYTALNIKPLTNLGTIEFRHMHGHNDPVLLDKWLRSISNLVSVASINPVNSDTLDNITVLAWYDMIFGFDEELHNLKMAVPSICHNSILDVKLGVM